MPTAQYMAEYRKRVYDERKGKIIEMLGGCCAKCGVRTNLEVDHIDPSNKKFEVLLKCWCMSWEKLLVEVRKCQILCERCHAEKTILDLGNKPARGTHGTLSSYRYCKCDRCKSAHNQWNKEYKRKARVKRGATIVLRTGLVHGTANGYAYYKCRCTDCRRANSDRSRKRRNAIVAQG